MVGTDGEPAPGLLELVSTEAKGMSNADEAANTIAGQNGGIGTGTAVSGKARQKKPAKVAGGPTQVASGATAVYGQMYYGGPWTYPPARSEKPGLYVYTAMRRGYDDDVELLGVYSTMMLAQAAVHKHARGDDTKKFPVYVGPLDTYGEAPRHNTTLVRFEQGDDYEITRHRIVVDEELDMDSA